MSSKDINDPLLDHSYDGIQEYDNPLPGWWKLIFWVSIIFAVPYTVYVHFMEGHTILDAYNADMEANTLNKNWKVDAATILAISEDHEMMEKADGLFQANCKNCHNPEGSGMQSLGPNLTDKHWKNVRKVTDIFDVISNGVTGTAMPAQTTYSKDQQILLSAYVVHLSNNYKEGLPPEGEEVATWPSESN